MQSQLLWSHFYVAQNGRITGFCLEKCEQCGRDTQAANSITLCEPVSRLLSLGLVQSPTLPPEEYYVEEFEATACEHCIPPLPTNP